jgi:hypothetical protein
MWVFGHRLVPNTATQILTLSLTVDLECHLETDRWSFKPSRSSWKTLKMRLGSWTRSPGLTTRAAVAS